VKSFHGDRRAKSPEALNGVDVVLTTYATLAADWKKRRVLQSVAWFRVVLDEGKSPFYYPLTYRENASSVSSPGT